MSVVAMVLLILACALGALLLLAALLVVIPFGLQARGSIRGLEAQATVSCAWAFGLIRLGFVVPGGAELRLVGARLWHGSLPSLRGRRRDPKPARGEARRGQGRRRLSLWRRGHALLGVVRRFVEALRLRVAARGEFGLSDPADTAMLFALLQQLGRVPGIRLTLRPNYLDEELTMDLELSGRVWLLHLGAITVGLLLRDETRKALLAS